MNLTFLFTLKCFSDFRDCIWISFGSIEEVTSAIPLNEFCPVKSSELTETDVAVNDGATLHLCIANDKVSSSYKIKRISLSTCCIRVRPKPGQVHASKTEV